MEKLNDWISTCQKSSISLLGLKKMLRIQTQKEANALNPYASLTIAEEEIQSRFQARDRWRPIFEPGDVMIFDQWTVHRTFVQPTMSQSRLSIEMRVIAETDVPEADRESSFKKVVGSWF